MRLGIISDAHHYYNSDDLLCTLSLLARQFEQWAEIFDKVTVCAPLLQGPPPSLFTPYATSSIKLLPVKNAGGNTPSAKLNLIKTSIGWVKTINELLGQVDAVHIRCPNNISIPGLFALQRTRLLRHAVYTGSWIGHPNEPMSYRAQRLYLKYLFKGPVSVYGDWPNQPSHVVPSFSPSYSIQDWKMESDQVEARINKLKVEKKVQTPINILTVGSLNKNKNQSLVIRSIKGLIDSGYPCNLIVIGDGIERENLERMVSSLGIEKNVNFAGKVSHKIVREYYRKADFVIQAPYSEGFGKVPIEAMFHGVIPILSDVDMSKQIVGDGVRGKCFPQGDVDAAIRIILELRKNPSEMSQMIQGARVYTKDLTLEAWQKHIISTLNNHWYTDLSVKKHAFLD